MASLKSVARRLQDRVLGTSFDRALARAAQEPYPSFLFCWNRGMGDIALKLVPQVALIRQRSSGAWISVITRDDLKSAFELTDVDEVFVLPGLERGVRIVPASACTAVGIDRIAFRYVIGDRVSTRLARTEVREVPRTLSWNPDWDPLATRHLKPFPHKTLIAVHVHTETTRYYGYVKDWSAAAWQDLFSRFRETDGVQWVLLGHKASPRYEGTNIIDLRGRTTLPELFSLIKNRCRVLIAPDSGVLTMVYCLGASFPIDLISLWSDPRQGILKYGGTSPNRLLRHVELIGPNDDVRNLPVARVAAEVSAALSRVRAAQPGKQPVRIALGGDA